MREHFDYTLPRKNEILNSLFYAAEGERLALFDTSALIYPDVRRMDLDESQGNLSKTERYCHVLSRQLYNTEFNDLDKETKNKLRESVIKYRINYSKSIEEFPENRDVLLIHKVIEESSCMHHLNNMFEELKTEGRVSKGSDLGSYSDLKNDGLYSAIFYYILENRGDWVSKRKLPKKGLSNNTDEHLVTTSIYASHMLERPVVVFSYDCDISDELNGFFDHARRFNTDLPDDLREIAGNVDISTWGKGKTSLTSLHKYFETRPRISHPRRELVQV